MGKVTLTRPDGSQIEANYEDVEQYKALGYQPESAQSQYSRNIQQAKEDYFTSPGQRTAAGFEGFLNGLTVGGYTGITNDDDQQDRARYNPGTRLGGEIVGAILPSMLPGGAEAEGIRIAEMGGELLAHTPQGLLTRGAEAIAEGTTATKTGHALVKGAVEGAGMGAGAAVTNAQLSGDPVTAEAVVAGMGWGALFGGGLGYAGGKIGVAAEARAAKAAEAEVAASKGFVAEEKWGAFRSALNDVRDSSAKTLDDTAARIAADAGKLEDTETLAAHVTAHSAELEKSQNALFDRVSIKGGWLRKGATDLKNEILKTRATIAKKLKVRDFRNYEELSVRYSNQMAALGDLAKVAMPEAEPFLAKAAMEGTEAMKKLEGLTAITETLKDVPFTPEGFTRMTPTKVEKIVAATEKFLKDAPEELGPQKDALGTAINNLAADAGLKFDGLTPAETLKATWESMRSAGAKGSAEVAEKLKVHGFGTQTAKYVASHEATSLMKQAGGGLISRSLAREGAHRLVGGLLSIAGGVKGMLLDGVSKLALRPETGKALRFVGPKIDPLMVRLDGSLEEKAKPRKQLMMARMREIREAAPTINDTLYRAVEPLVGQHTELAAGVNKAAVAMFNALVLRMPRDPGKSFNRMQSLWSPDPIMQEQFARAYEVFQNPVGVALRYLRNPRSITPEGARALQEMNPELWNTLRTEMIMKLGQPGMLDSMGYSEQVGLGHLLDIRIHSTQSPEFIKAQQLMFQKREEPLPARPSASDNNSNNPSGTSRGMTAAQRITEH